MAQHSPPVACARLPARCRAMDDGGYPCFLDIEATGFGPESYPIEVAWSDASGGINRYLIDPTPIAAWTAWDASAEAVHGIDRERLARNGWSPEFVAERITEDLGGRIVHTDAPDYDARWLARLFQALGRPMPCILEHIDELLIARLCRNDQPVWQVMQRIAALKRETAAVSGGKHSAGYDVGYLIQLWRHANGEPVKMNHGAGPLPLTTATGTFVRLKQPETASAPEH
jgi:hypothetical protein